MAFMFTSLDRVHLNGRLHDRQPRTRQIWPTTSRGRTRVRAQTDISFCSSYEDAENVMFARVRKQLLSKRFADVCSESDSNQHTKCLHRLRSFAAGRKFIVALAGIPGSGKSTCAGNLVKKLNEVHEVAVTVPMDGFHFYRCDLDQMPDPAHAHDRRGAAFTINAPVFVNCLRRLLDDNQIAHPIPFPSFDHAVGDPVQDDVWVKPEHQVVVVEGLYLLRDEEPWGDLDEIFDDKWLLRTDVDAAMGHVVARQVEMGAHEADARCRVNSNDRVNALEVYGICRRPDFIIDVSAAA